MLFFQGECFFFFLHNVNIEIQCKILNSKSGVAKLKHIVSYLVSMKASKLIHIAYVYQYLHFHIVGVNMGKRHFNEEWLDNPDANGQAISLWCIKKDNFTATCKLCNTH